MKCSIFVAGRTSKSLWSRRESLRAARRYQIHPAAIHSKSIRTGNSQFRRQLWGLAFAFKGARVLVVSSLSLDSHTQDNIIPGYFVLCGRTSGVGIKQPTALRRRRNLQFQIFINSSPGAKGCESKLSFDYSSLANPLSCCHWSIFVRETKRPPHAHIYSPTRS